MKEYAILVVLILSLISLSCKNDKAKKDSVLDTTESVIEIENEVDSLKQLEKTTIEEEISDIIPSEGLEKMLEENAATIKNDVAKTIKKEVTETTEQVVIEVAKETEQVVEETIIESTEEIVEPIEEIVETVEKVEQEIETKPEVIEVIEKEIPIEPEPVVEKPIVVVSPNTWIVPSKYKTMKNPTDPKVDLAIGKSLYDKHCKSCHGKKGLGDGTKADEVEGDLGDFSSKEFQAQTDGELFYKSYIGRDDMPNYEKKIPDEEDVWLIVNYMRTMGE